jgi:hypothetical protein
VRLQLADARFCGLEIVDADVRAPDFGRRLGAERPALEYVPPGQIVLLDQIVGGPGGGGALTSVLGTEQAQDAVEPNDVFLLNLLDSRSRSKLQE